MTSQNAEKIRKLLEDAEITGAIGDIDYDLVETTPGDDADEVHLRSYVVGRIADYLQDRHLQGYELLGQYQEDFGGWGIAQFNSLDTKVRRKLRSTLQYRGIYLGPKEQHISPQLEKLLNARTLPQWPDEALDETLFHPDSRQFDLQRRRREKGQSPRIPTTSTAPAVPTRTRQLVEEDEARDKPIIMEDQRSKGSDPLTLSREPSMPTLLPTISNPYEVLPPLEIPNTTTEPQQVTNFAKVWNKAQSYTGEPYDLLDDKIRMFLGSCRSIHIQPGQFHAVFPYMLAGEAYEYFLHNVGPHLTFAGMYNKLKVHFDHEINHEQYHADWIHTTFVSMKAGNTDKDNMAVLKLLLDKLRLCQRALGPSYSGDHQLVNQTITACRGVPELEAALQRPARTFEALASDLRSSCKTAQVRSTQFPADGEQYFLDRRYGNNRSSSNSCPNSSNRSGNDIRSDSRPSRYNENRLRGGYSNGSRPQWKKKCYVCGEIGCSSTKHTSEERQGAREQFRRLQRFSGAYGLYRRLLRQQPRLELPDRIHHRPRQRGRQQQGVQHHWQPCPLVFCQVQARDPQRPRIRDLRPDGRLRPCLRHLRHAPYHRLPPRPAGSAPDCMHRFLLAVRVPCQTRLHQRETLDGRYHGSPAVVRATRDHRDQVDPRERQPG